MLLCYKNSCSLHISAPVSCVPSGKKVQATQEDERLGWWLSAALEDPELCAEMKQAVEEWFKSKDFGEYDE